MVSRIKLPRTKKKKAEDPVIAKAKFKIKILEENADQAASNYLRDIDDVFDPAKRKALAEKLDLTEDAILNELQTISERKENQKMVKKIADNWYQAGKDAVTTVSLELEQFFDESVNKYVINERAIDAEIEEKHPTEPPSEAEDLATTIALNSDIVVDAKDGVLNIGKLTELLAKQPQTIPVSRGGYIGRTPADDEQERHNKAMEDGLNELKEIAKQQARPHVFKHDIVKSPKQEELDKAKEELALKNKVIADMFAERQRKKQNNLGGNDPVSNFKQFIGLKQYEDYCKENNKRGQKVCGTDHLEDFHADEIYSGRIKESIDYHKGENVNISVPKTDDGTTWRGIQTEVFKKLGIKKGGKSRSRKGNRRQL